MNPSSVILVMELLHGRDMITTKNKEQDVTYDSSVKRSTVASIVSSALPAIPAAPSITASAPCLNATPEETRAALDAMAAETLAKLFAEQPDALTLYALSARP